MRLWALSQRGSRRGRAADPIARGMRGLGPPLVDGEAGAAPWSAGAWMNRPGTWGTSSLRRRFAA
eukprot:14500853-Alexandrium_andersonii.AAC.1